MLCKIMHLSGSNFSYTSLMTASVVYGLFGSSTPSRLGAVELIIAALLIFASLSQVPALRYLKRDFFAGYVFLICMLIVPSCIGFLRGVELTDYGRDIIAFVFLMMFLVYQPLIHKNPNQFIKNVSLFVVFIGAVFSARYFYIDDVHLNLLGASRMFGDMRYLPMDPAVTFGAFFALVKGFFHLRVKEYFNSTFFLLISFLCFGALVGMLIRAPIILYFLVFSFLLVFFISVKIISFFILLILLILTVKANLFYSIFYLTIEKFNAVGWNNKGTELITVIQLIFSDSKLFLLGAGWGALVQTPVYEGAVRFVHNFFIYFLFKAGFLGAIFASVVIVKYYFFLLYMTIKIWFLKRNPRCYPAASSIAILATFTSSMWLQPTFKSLTFGLILAISAALVVIEPSLRWQSNCGRQGKNPGQIFNF